MKLYSYVVARDFGFAPNPFHGYCTLATCKPRIRETAEPGDWVIGTGSARYGLSGTLVYAMKVAEALTFNHYWDDTRFQAKKPNMRLSVKYAYGDNIYHRGKRGWQQSNSHHSRASGRMNRFNVQHDTQTDRVLVATEYVYFGGNGPTIPHRFRNNAADVCAVRGHKCNFPERVVERFVAWLAAQERGIQGSPREYERTGAGT